MIKRIEKTIIVKLTINVNLIKVKYTNKEMSIALNYNNNEIYVKMESNERIKNNHAEISTILNDLIEKLIKTSIAREDGLNVLLLLILIENGFELLDIDENISIDLVKYVMSRQVKNNKSFCALFTFGELTDISLKLVTNYLGDIVFVNAFISETRETFTMCIKLTEMDNFKTSENILKYLEKLRFDFDFNKLIQAIKCSIIKFHKLPSPCILGLPEEILLEILINLDVKDVLNISETCKGMNKFIKGDRLWYLMCKRDFYYEHDPQLSWKDEYKMLFVEDQKKRRLRSDPFVNINIDSLSLL